MGLPSPPNIYTAHDQLVQTLRRLKNSKGRSGKGRLTDNQIDLLQTYYGLAIRRKIRRNRRNEAGYKGLIFP